MSWKARPRPCRGGFRFKLHGKQFWRKSEAEAWALLRKLTASTADTLPDPINVAELVEAWAVMKEHTRGTPNRHAEEMLAEFVDGYGACRLDALPVDVLERYLGQLRTRPTRRHYRTPPKILPGLGVETLRKKIKHAHAVLAWGQRRGFLKALPDMPRIAPPAFKGKALSSAELTTLLKRLAEGTRTKHVLPLVRFILETGARPGEARTAEWADIDLARRVWTIPHHKVIARLSVPRAKVIPLSDVAVSILAALPRADRFVFLSYRGKPYTRDGLGSILRRYNVPIYRLRHTWCQAAADADVDPATLAELMGHADSAMIRHYVSVADARKREAVARVNGLSQLPPADPIPPAAPPPTTESRSGPGTRPPWTERTAAVADASRARSPKRRHH